MGTNPKSSGSEFVREIYADSIDDPQEAMRSVIDQELLWDLAADIKKNGLINPITVRPRGDRYEVVAGHRRFTACKMAAILRIPCVVRDVDDDVAFSIRASENLVREDVDPVDEANFLLRIMQKTGKDVAAIAALIRKSEGYVRDRLVVASMPDYLQNYLQKKQIKLGAALALNEITDDAKRRLWVEMAVRDGVSVRGAEYWLYQWRKDLLPEGSAPDPLAGLAGDGEYRPLLFRCAVDGKEYPAADTQMVSVYRGNLYQLEALRTVIRDAETAEMTPPLPGGGEGVGGEGE